MLDDSEDLLTEINQMRSHLKLIKGSHTLKNDNQTELQDNQTLIDSLEDEKKEMYTLLKELEPMCEACNKIGGVLVEEQYRN